VGIDRPFTPADVAELDRALGLESEPATGTVAVGAQR
jgi:hypothetical protein